MGRIRALPSGVANHVRASQVIGSIERGVEELLQNSITHASAKCVSVTMGKKPNDDFVVVVEDDGIGIDNDSMRTLIGTEACCNDSVTVFGNQGRGDSLRSIAALCVEVKIESTFKSKNGNISSSKVIQNGVTVSFEDSTDHGSSSSSILPSVQSIPRNNTGTRITLLNMFQQFAVRRKYNHSKDLLAAVRSMMSMLSLIYPLVSFKLVDGETGKVDSMFDAPRIASNFSGSLSCRVPPKHGHGFSATLEDEANALVERMDEMNSDEDSMGRRSIKLAGEDCNAFRAFGVINLFDDDTVCSGRKMQLQIAVNGRPSAQAKELADIIHDNVKKYFGGNSYTTAGFVHMAAKESELVIKESAAMENVSDLGRMSTFLAIMIARTADGKLLGRYNHHSTDADSEDNGNSHSRIVKGQYITAKAAATKLPVLHQSSPYQTSRQSSPFSNVFGENCPPNENRMEDVKSNVSFDDAFLDESTTIEDMMDTSHSYDDIEEVVPSMSWTRNRIKALNSTIAVLVPSGSQAHTIAFTKEMLSSAEVISQVDSSFITLKMGSLICAVDQHAADERVSLEALENALFRTDSHDAMIISLTKRQLQVGDILKSCPVAPLRTVLLTMSQMTTARHYYSLLHKWKFSFEESSTEERTIIMRGLPSVCGRVAQTSDLLEFLNELGCLTGGNSIKPKFVSRVLASNACRYATMFGDALTLQQCEKLIDALSKCQLPFVCAHGRPSIIPLIDMSQGSSTNEKTVRNSTQQADQKWGPTRVRRQNKYS